MNHCKGNIILEKEKLFSGSLSFAMPSHEKLAGIKQLLNKPDQPEQALKRHGNYCGFQTGQRQQRCCWPL